jgi:hypothetical protein
MPDDGSVVHQNHENEKTSALSVQDEPSPGVSAFFEKFLPRKKI